MKKEFHLVLSYDSSNEAFRDIIQQVVVEKSREIFGATQLMQAAMDPSSPKPEIHIYSDDFIMGKEDIEVKNEEQATAADNLKG